MSEQHSQQNLVQANIDADDMGHNTSNNPSFDQILAVRLSRRGLLKGGFSLMAASVLGTGLVACGGGGSSSSSSTDNNNNSGNTNPTSLSFTPVAKSLADALVIPTGYTATVLYALGDPLNNNIAAYKNDGTDTDFDYRAGDHHDGMHYFGLDTSTNKYAASNADAGLLCMNHENMTQLFLHTASETATARTAAQVDKEIAVHGVSVVEIRKSSATYAVNKASAFNRRITAATTIDMSGPAAGDDMLFTKYSPTGVQTRGTLNNCANGYTPWGTYLTCEENWAGYFKTDTAALATGKEKTSRTRYGVSSTEGGYGWANATPTDDKYARWNITATGATAADDYRNAANTFGWVVEIDPFDATSTPKKRTALGRFAHEGCWPAKAVAGKPLVFYMGDDSRNEYIYKFVSDALWDTADVGKGVAAGDKYLNAGKLYVAKFNADGTGSWVQLTLSNTSIATYTTYTFADEADVLINARLAADAVGATKMDRPEWGAVNPVTGEVYMTLTNSVSSSSGRGVKTALDAANPRYYTDTKGTTTNKGNVNGHIIRWHETGDNHAATSFQWDVFLFGAQADADSNINLSGLTAENDFSSPDGLWFSQASQGLLWIETDDGNYTDVTNCMLLAAIPGKVGDGGAKSVVNKAVPTNANADQTVTTYAGKTLATTQLARFLVGPSGCEITGIAETPDGKALFVNIQHPGEDTTSLADPAAFQSHWPSGGTARPRSATIVITRNDGSKIAV